MPLTQNELKLVAAHRTAIYQAIYESTGVTTLDNNHRVIFLLPEWKPR
jgi:hypothetical protein